MTQSGSFSIRAGSLPFADAAMPDVVAIFKGEARLLAFDFWIRNPDYLAAELLDLFEETAQPEYSWPCPIDFR